MSLSLYIATGLLVLGLLIKFGKMYFLIAGINTMSDDQRADYNFPKIGNLFFVVCLFMSALTVIGYFVGIWLDNEYIEFVILVIAIIIGLIVILAKINSDRYKNFEE